MLNQTTQTNPKTNVQPVAMDLKGDAGKRVILNTAKRIMKTHAKEIKALADNNLIMPPKSTYIEPKFRSGLVVYEL